MIIAAKAVLFMFLNLILYFLFGMLVTVKRRKDDFSVTEAVFTGFFLYYFLFTLFCIPVMLKWRPLSMLTRIWGAVMIAVCVISVIFSVRIFKKKFPKCIKYIAENKFFLLGIVLITVIQAFIIIYNYQFTLDAAYYVANVTTSIETDTLNIYDPYTGDWQDHFEMRYFFATFPLNDAVLCDILKIHPLIWCKSVMAGTSVILTNMVLFMIGKKLFLGDHKKILLFMFFSDIMDFFFITIFTTSTFLVTRTYEGKCLLANVVLPGMFYIYLKLFENTKDRHAWLMLLLVALGSPVLSSSSNMLVPAMIAVTILPLTVLKKDWTVTVKSVLCMLPGIIMLLTYAAYVKGMFVLYTYPR